MKEETNTNTNTKTNTSTMGVVSDQDIARGVETILHQNATVSSLNGVVQQLGAKLGLDLSHKTAFIRDHINFLLFPPPRHHPLFLSDHFALQNHYSSLHYPFQNPHFALPHAPSPPQLYHAPPPPPPVAAAAAQPVKHASAAVAKSPKESTQSGGKRRGGAGGLTKLCGISPQLQVIVGEAAMARTEVVKQLWNYIRKNNLQDPSNKRKIICDEALRTVFEIDATDMFKMNKLLSKHILPLDPATANNFVSSKRQKVDIESTAEPAEGACMVTISDALAHFLGTTVKTMLASEATQQVLEYIKVNSLEDSSSATVICDEKLKELFGCESIPMLGINDALARYHLVQCTR